MESGGVFYVRVGFPAVVLLLGVLDLRILRVVVRRRLLERIG